MKIFALPRLVSIAVGFFLCFPFLDAQVTIQTFHDANNNGIQDPGENLITGLIVTATDVSGNTLPLLDDGNGTFFLPGELVTSRLRIKVEGYDGSPYQAGVAGPTSVFFVENGASVLVPVSTGPNFSVAESRIMIPCYDGGPAEGKTSPAFVSFPYTVDGIATSKGGSEVDPQTDAETQEIGSTWGVAYQNTMKRAFASAILKRHTGLGPEGTGGLYMIDYSGSEPVVSAMNLQGIVPSGSSTPIDFGSITRNVVDGGVDETQPNALTTDPTRASYDMDAFPKIGTTSFGDIDVEEDERTLWMVNLHQKSLISMDVSDVAVTPGTQTIKHYLMSDMTGLPNLNYRYAMCINTGGNLNGTGAEPFTDHNRVAWDKNKYSVGGGSQYSPVTVTNLMNATDKTSESLLYHSYRRGPEFSYEIPVPVAETYTVTLHFAEPNTYAVGDRIFDIIAENTVKASAFDIVAHAGGNRKATTMTFEVEAMDGVLNLDFVAKQGAKVKQALLSGIEVIGQSIMPSGELRPWGLNFHNGLGYLGVVADGSISKSREHLFGFVLQFDPQNMEAGFTEVLAFPLAYPRERASNAHLPQPQPLRSAEWQAWVSEWESTVIQTKQEQLSASGALLCAYPQPLISDINFTSDGGIVLALMDRWAHQVGYRNYPGIVGDQTLIVGYAAGDILRGFDDQGILRLETENFDNGNFFRKDDGPSFEGEFFYDDHFVASAAHHGEISTGGTGLLRGSGEVVNTTFNPLKTDGNINFEFSGVYTQGIQFYNTTNGAKERAYLFVEQYNVLGKANGLGDLEFASELIGGEMGNYVWCDGNGNGIQDPEEFGIDGVMLTLHDKENSDALVDMQTTSNGGQFIFTGLLPNHCYSIRIDLSKLIAMGFSGLVPPDSVGMDRELDSDGDPNMIPGFSVAMFCTGAVGENDHSIDFAFLGPEANPCDLVACADMMGMGTCADFSFATIRNCVLPSGSMNNVTFYANLVNDSLVNPITVDPIRVCTPDSCIYARVSIPGDTMCFAIAKVTMNVIDPLMSPMPVYERLACLGTTVDLEAVLTENALDYMSVTFYSNMAKTIPIMNPNAHLPMSYPDTSYFMATLNNGGCDVMGSVIIIPNSGSLVDAGAADTICGFTCVDLTALGAFFNANGSGATLAEWSSTGGGTFLDSPRFGEARMYCPDSMDVANGSVLLTLTVMDDPCMSVSDNVIITIESPLPMLIPGPNDTIDCTHPFVMDPAAHDTFPGCRYIFGCEDTIVGSVVDYDLLVGDCFTIVKQIKRTHRIVYGKDEFFCMDTISVRALPDTVICPPERDSVYCHTGYLKDENGHPSPLETGVPMADSIPLWPQPPSVCDILVIYKDTEFLSDCPMTIRREWFIKNNCTGEFDSCVQWLMIFDTIGPALTKYDTAAFFVPIPTSTHDCYAEVYAPSVTFEDTCTGVKQVKAVLHGVGTAIMEYNSETKCYESHEKFRVPISEIDIINDVLNTTYITYEALDYCHNQTVLDSVPIFIVDRVKPVAICDKGVNVTVSDTIQWVHAETFNEGTWDNCGISMLLARRSDWATACGVDLCDDVHFLFSGEHHDSVWCVQLEEDKHINPVEAHYAKAIDWLCQDGQLCSYPVLMGWFYDLVKYGTLDCIEHPYEVDQSYLDNLFLENYGEDAFLDVFQSLVLSVIPCIKPVDSDSLFVEFFDFFANDANEVVLEGLLRDIFNIAIANGLQSTKALFDVGKQIGGGWSDAVPFCCEDACQDVTVEILAMDYWCNWSKCWTTVRVEDKTPPEVVCELYDATITCSSYKTYYQAAVELALEGEFDSLQNVLGRYDKVSKDQYGNVAEKSTYKLYELDCDSSLVTKDSLVYDEHLGYIWKTYSYYRAEYELDSTIRFNGQIADNCGLICIEEKPWVNLDACGNGYIKRVFKFVGQCSDEANGHFADTITRHQTIWVTNDCHITKAMFDVPKDTIVYSCGIEYATDGSGNVAGLVSPEYTGQADYLFDNDCRLVGIGYYDKVFKIVGGDEACYKVIRTWCFGDWCVLGEPIEKSWWLDSKYAGKYLTCTQKIIVFDSQPPICTIDSLPAEVNAAGCYYDLNTEVLVEDECGVLSYSWRVIDTKTDLEVAAGHGDLNSSLSDRFNVTAAGLGQGDYKLKVIVTDECQNESICDVPFVVNANKKPTPVCITSLTAELTPMDLNLDGEIDTAMAEIWAYEFNQSSQAACGSSEDQLTYRIDDGQGEPELPPATATKLDLGCEHQGTNQVRLYVVDESGTWDYCTVLLVVQDNMAACGAVTHTNGMLTGEILTEMGDKVEQVRVMVEGTSGVALWQAEDVSGEYQVAVTAGVEAFVRPTKNTDPLNGVSTGDLVAIQKDILGKSPLDSWYKEKAADSNDDGKVSAIDLIELRKLILGKIDQLPASDSWRFYEKETNKKSYHIDKMLEEMRVDFVGVKIGDVNGSTNPALKAGRSSEALTLSVDRGFSDHEIIFRSSSDLSISGIQFTLEIDKSKLQIISLLEEGKLQLSSEHVNLERQSDGWITLSWNSPNGEQLNISKGENLFGLKISKGHAVELSDVMTISSKVAASEVYFSPDLVGNVNLEFNAATQSDRFSLLQNRPNPWKHTTVIGFSVPEAAETILTLFDVHGRLIKEVSGFTAKGYHEWSVDGQDIPGTGVYYYKLETNNRTAIRKMILMD
ncbi:MAG: T9SS type A sorting domain-containing protein [Saprospiraceae bacterium]|nr:T9SS type A sorting domain-containing protein [Saprospiraceae bacterium]